ncbi:MAG: anthranilate synthase component I family protein [Bacteroidetes bacterium]|nr:anthranilate synthase component I family protein [Bacteroidota bacterium]
MNRVFKPFAVDDLEAFKHRMLCVSGKTHHFCLLESNDYDLYPHSNFGFFIAIESLGDITGQPDEDFLDQLRKFHELHRDWMFGFLSYDLKNQIERTLTSENPDHVDCPPGHFFIPKYLIRFHNGRLSLGVTDEQHRKTFEVLLEQCDEKEDLPKTKRSNKSLTPRMSKPEYTEKVEKLKDHIQRGDIYETNFCMEFYMEDNAINPVSVFEHLNDISKAPFGAFLKKGDLSLMCSSPERYLKKWQDTVISQPIKGTIRRGENDSTDQLLKEALLWDPKERSENVMIVDLVRNDLSKIARKGSVNVEELFGIYTFEQVHQMISTVTCKVDKNLPFTEIIRATYPMGSMTGAPKYRSMELIEKYETTQRGLYSGAMGYVTPQSNFDFNVVIRSIVHNATNQYTSVQVGSALTIDCNAEYEYDECMLKAKAMKQALGHA